MKEWTYSACQLINELGGNNIGVQNITINTASTLDNIKTNSLMFFTKKKWKEKYKRKIGKLHNCCIIIEPELIGVFADILFTNCIIEVDNARLYFAKAIRTIIKATNNKREYQEYRYNCIIGEDVYIGENCLIEPFVMIDHDVKIGDNVIIKSGAKIRQNVIIGNNVVIGENSVIGAQGFGVEHDDKNKNIRIPHIGGVIIEDDVEIGALASIVAGTIQPTIIKKNVFIDDLNHIAHNCYIGEHTLTTAAVQIGGSAKIGTNCYISPNATIRNGISLGDNTFVGQASSVQKTFENDASLVGNPAKIFNYKK